MKYILTILFMLIVSSFLTAQQFTLSGYVKDSASSEDLVGVNIYDLNHPENGTTCNAYGYYALNLSSGHHTIVYQFVGYKKKEIEIDLKSNQRVNVRLKSVTLQLDEVLVSDTRSDENVKNTEMSTTNLTIKEIKSIPAFMGEVDILKVIQLLPGVQSAGEGNTGLYVRGGGPDQNLILLDEAVVYNTGHLFGFFSVFNSDAIKNTKLIKGGIPANYGGRLSSVLDVQMLDGNDRQFHAQGGVGLISSRLTLQGPIVKNKASYMISGRRTYADVLARPFLNGTKYEGNGYFFYDLNAKVNYRFSDKDRVYLSGYFGKDVFTYKSSSSDFKINIPWGNATATARWNHLFSDKLFMNASLIYNDYNFLTEGTQLDFSFTYGSGIRDYGVKTDFDYYLGNNHKLKFGASYIYHIFTPVTVSFSSSADSIDMSTNLMKKYAFEGGAYALYETDINHRLRFNMGLRYSTFQQIGPYDHAQRNAEGVITDTLHFAKGENVKFFQGLEPRLSLRLMLDDYSSLKVSATFTKQYLHLVSNSSTTLPTDVWVASSLLVKPENAIQYAIGYFRNFTDNAYETSLELYYKSLSNQIEFKDGYTPEFNVETEEGFVFGQGRSYGAELLIKKNKGKLTGWIGYTYSKTTRTFPDINNGNPFPATYDRRHDLSVVASYHLSKKWNFGALFVYGSGNAYTMPEGWYLIEGNLVTQYGERNSYRMEAYHRMDISATFSGKPDRKLHSEWVFSIYNVYNHLNPYFIFFENQGDLASGNLNIKAKQVSIFPIIPSITWNFKF